MTAAALLLATACPLFVQGPAQEHPIKLPGADALVARDPYGGTLARNRLFFDFSLRGDIAHVAKAEWALDGKTVQTDDTKPFEWKGQSGSSKRMPAGDHTITVTAFNVAGEQASTQFALTATDCQNAGVGGFVPRHPGTTELSASATQEPADTRPPFDGVTFTATKNVTVARSPLHGTLDIVPAHGATKSYRFGGSLKRGTLRVTTRPGAKRFLSVTGLPSGTVSVKVRLGGGTVRLRDVRHEWLISGTLTGGGRSVTAVMGGAYA